MAIVIPGKTKCPACGKAHQENEELISFPALCHETHKYRYCSDGAFHVSCFNEWEHSEAALAKREEYLEFYDNEKPEIQKVWNSLSLKIQMSIRASCGTLRLY